MKLNRTLLTVAGIIIAGISIAWAQTLVEFETSADTKEEILRLDDGMDGKISLDLRNIDNSERYLNVEW